MFDIFKVQSLYSYLKFTLIKIRKEDAGFYEVVTNGQKLFGELMVDEKPVVFKSGFSDMTVNFDEEAIFNCEVADAEATGLKIK